MMTSDERSLQMPDKILSSFSIIEPRFYNLMEFWSAPVVIVATMIPWFDVSGNANRINFSLLKIMIPRTLKNQLQIGRLHRAIGRMHRATVGCTQLHYRCYQAGKYQNHFGTEAMSKATTC